MQKRISYARCKELDLHYRLLKKKVDQAVSGLSPVRKLHAQIRAVGIILLYVSIYLTALLVATDAIAYYLLFGCMGILIVIIFLNLVHEAVHNNLFRNKKVNRWMLFIFDCLGANSFIWKKRHEILHHNFPNVSGWDSDIEQAGLFKIYPHEVPKPVHKIQHRTFVLLYPFYIVNWLFVRDFKDFFSSRQIVRKVCKIRVREYLVLFGFKLFFIFYSVVLPVLLGVTIFRAVAGMILMLIVAGVFALLVLLTPHVNVTNAFPMPDSQNKLTTGWLWHQLITTNDVTLNNWLSRSVMANFNFHVAHHLFPHISYVFLPEVTNVIRLYAEENQLPYRSYPIVHSLKAHIELIRQNAIDNSIFEEDM